MKWVGLVGCVALAVAWRVTAFGFTLFQVGHLRFGFARGGVLAYGPVDTSRLGVSVSGWMPGPDLAFLPERGFTSLGTPRYFVPMWIPFLALAIPTYILWRRDRRKPEGCCQQCGYDLTGNESGVCPECGTKIERP